MQAAELMPQKAGLKSLQGDNKIPSKWLHLKRQEDGQQA